MGGMGGRRLGLWAEQVGDWWGGEGLMGRGWQEPWNEIGRLKSLWAGQNVFRGGASEKAVGRGGDRTLSTRPSGLSNVARAMVFTCSVYRVWGSRSCERNEITGAEGRRLPGPAPSVPAPGIAPTL